ncbi:hypothetical protein Amsp01_103180 [Amycolatopsis sp. NBRC 101858]|nr:hypothetical protein Amsp01_103180 [Amycolatopsis sp. NBRC 101858]
MGALTSWITHSTASRPTITHKAFLASAIIISASLRAGPSLVVLMLSPCSVCAEDNRTRGADAAFRTEP